MVDLTKDERLLLEWLSKDDGQYGECHGKTLDGLIERGLAMVHGVESGLVNGFIAKGADIMYRAVSITDSGRQALTPPVKRWEVRTRVILMRYYYVDAEDRKSAEVASCEASCDHEEEENEETMEISEIVAEASSISSTNKSGAA